MRLENSTCDPWANSMLRFPPLLLVLAATAVLSGCGKSENKAAKIETEKAIYMSAADCADGGKVAADMCAALIDKAVKMHEVQAPTFKSLTSCEKESGPERCERSGTNLYRMRLQAFMFEIIGKQAMATPLYPSADAKIGFRDAAKKPIDAKDENLIVSQASLTLAHENAKIGKKR